MVGCAAEPLARTARVVHGGVRCVERLDVASQQLHDSVFHSTLGLRVYTAVPLERVVALGIHSTSTISEKDQEDTAASTHPFTMSSLESHPSSLLGALSDSVATAGGRNAERRNSLV